LDQVSRPFKVERGIKQGCVLSPKLFNAALQTVMSKIDWSKYGIKLLNSVLGEMRFADDVVIIAQNKQNLLMALDNLFEESAIIGLSANMDKTKIMSNTDDTTFKVKNQAIEKVKDYKYLGQVISFEDRSMKETNARISSAWKSFWSLKRFLLGNLALEHKKRLFDSCVLPVFTYGCQTWAFTDACSEKLSIAQRKMERTILKVKWSQRISNEIIRKRSKWKDVAVTSKTLKWSWAGHLQRLNDDRLAKEVELWSPQGCRRIGKPKQRWKQEIEEHASFLWRKKARNRTTWKKLGESFAQKAVYRR
jgi:hypothetical protein